MDDARLTIVATLTVRRDAAGSFRAFEHIAARVMAYGGAIEHTIIIESKSENESDTFKEIHIITFPSADAFARYRADAVFAQAHRCDRLPSSTPRF